MANPIPCDACGAPSDILVTNVATGDVLAFCGNHAGEGLGALAATLGYAPPAAELDPSTTRIDTGAGLPSDTPSDTPAGDGDADPTGPGGTPDTEPGTPSDTEPDSGTDGESGNGSPASPGDGTATGDPGDSGAPSDQLDEQRALAAATAPY